jgi:hypothetical protein
MVGMNIAIPSLAIKKQGVLNLTLLNTFFIQGFCQ